MAKTTAKDYSTAKNYAGGMIIDGIAASEAIDSSGEIFSVEGADITNLQNGTATLNWEHRGDDSPDHTASDHVGIITYAKKIFSASDCDNDRESMYWDEIKLPFIYIKARLYDGAGHRAAQDLAAQIRDHHLNGEPILVRYSIEGQTITQEGPLLKETICKRVAATIKPCNRSCQSGVLADPNSPFESMKVEEDALKSIKKREFEHPLYSRLSVSVTKCSPWVRDEKTEKAEKTDKPPKSAKDLPLKNPKKEAAPKTAAELPLKNPRKQPVTTPEPAPLIDWGDVQFDGKRGVLYSNGRKFPVSIPHDALYREALNDPHVREVHGRAMHNWSIVHKLLGKGKILPGILIAAGLNAGFSSNTSVPLQELAFGHFNDLANETGYDITSGPLSEKGGKALLDKFRSRVLPQWMRDWYERHPEGIKTAEKPNEPSKVRIVGLQEDKIDAVRFYHRIHPILQKLLSEHGADGQAIARALIGHKKEYDLWKTRMLSQARKEGRETTSEDRLAFDGPVVEQLAVKTLRYAIAMMGAGNVVVPDTHFIRHFFGLPLAHPDNEFLKGVLLDPRNAHILDQIDEYHQRHHPSAKAVREWYFKGKDNPMVAFPAFWLHWLSIASHDALRGLPRASLAQHSNAAHDPFFHAASEAMREFGVPGHDKIVLKSEVPHTQPLPVRVALACEKLRREQGEGGAQVAYWAYMAPLLHDVEAEHLVAKFETLRDVLLSKAEKLAEPSTVSFNGRNVRPGAAEGYGSNVKGGRFSVVHRDRDHVYVQDQSGTLQRWPVEREGTHFRVLTNPVVESNDTPPAYISGDKLPGVISSMKGRPDMPVSLDSIYTLYAIHPKEDGTPARVASGRFLVQGGRLHVLEDHFGALHAILGGDGTVTPDMEERLETLHHSKLYDLVSDGQIERGERPDLVPETDLGEPMAPEEMEPVEQPAQKRDPVWEYHRQGLKSPQVVESRGGAMSLNGQALSHHEIQTILDNVKRGVATLTYRKVE